MTYCVGVEKCGCEVRQLHDGKAYIAYCTKHYAVTDLYEALKAVVKMQSTPQNERVSAKEIWRSVVEALAKAEGK